MSFIDSLKGLFQKQVNAAIFSFMNPTSMPMMGEAEYSKAYRGWVYACVNAIAQPVAEMDIKLEKKAKEKEGWQPVESHPALDILHNVNPFMSYYDLMFGTSAYTDLQGNVFWYLARNGGKTIAEIWPLDPTHTHVVKSPKNFIAGYVFQNDRGEKIPFETEEIIHFKTFNPRNPYRGLGTVAAAALAIDTDTYASEWQRNFFGNSAMPAAVLTSEVAMKQDQYDRIKENWEAKFRGVGNAHRTAILEGGLKFQPVSPTAKEMQFTDSRKNVRDEILAIFRVPKVVLGITEDVNYASAAASEYVYNKFVIKPRMKFIVTTLNEFYLPLWGLDQNQYRFNFTDPVPENQDQKRADRESGINSHYMTTNEVRDQLGLKPIEGGDIIYVPAGLVPLGTPPQQDTETPDDKKPKDEKPKDDKKPKKDVGGWVKGVKRVYKIGKPPKSEKYINKETKKLHKVYLKLNETLKTMIMDNLSKKSLVNALHKYWLLKKENNVVSLAFENYDDWITLVLDATKEGVQRIYEQSGKDGIAEVDVDISFDLENPRAVKWINAHALEASQSYTDSMKADIISILEQAIDAGQSVQSMAVEIEQFFADEDDWRAMRIARTETINAYSQGNLEGYRQSGVVAGKKWLPDSEACPICVANAEAGEIALNKNFPSGHDAPTAHPNCECALLPVVKKDLDDSEE